MSYEEKMINGTLIITVTEKRFDAVSSGPITSNLQKKVQEGQSNIVLNLKNVQFMDSTGLGCLVSLFKVIGKNGSLTLCHMTDAVKDLFSQTHLNTIFKIYTTEEEALQNNKQNSGL
ncbi:MAG: STAS domain-containing protein [Parachlamydiales bacterium]|nr:STAS domain-containing protein [Parachlamydiales bacterium]